MTEEDHVVSTDHKDHTPLSKWNKVDHFVVLGHMLALIFELACTCINPVYYIVPLCTLCRHIELLIELLASQYLELNTGLLVGQEQVCDA